MKIEATRAKILAVCCMRIAIANNMSSMGLVTKAINAVKKTNKKGFSTCDNCTKCHTPGRYNYPAKDSTSHTCQKTGHWKKKFKKTVSGAKKLKPQPQSQCHAGGRRGVNEVRVSEGDPAFDEVTIHV